MPIRWTRRSPTVGAGLRGVQIDGLLMTAPLYDTLRLRGETLDIITPARDEEPRALLDPNADGLPSAWWCACCGQRHVRCAFELLDDRLHLVGLVLDPHAKETVAPDWLPPPTRNADSGAVEFRGLSRPHPWTGPMLVASGRLTLDLPADDAGEAEQDEHDDSDVEPWALFERVLELDFDDGVLGCRVDISDVAARKRERLQRTESGA